MDNLMTKLKVSFQNLIAKIKNSLSKLKDIKHLFWFFMFLFALALVMSIATMFSNAGTIPLGGDYVQQQIPFYTNGYDDWWSLFTKGEFPLWDQNTVLGASNIGSNSFYYLLNPFFLPILIFPRSLIPQGLAILMLVKMALAGMTFRALLKYLGVSERTARVIAIAYAFCGWNIYYMWFNHFLEVCVVFPLILLGIERLLKEKKPLVLMLSLFLMGISNYFFLVFACFAGVIYAGFRFFQMWKKTTGKDKLTIMGLGVLSFATGILMCAFVLLPCINVVTGGTRVSDATFLDSLKTAFSSRNFNELFNLMFKFSDARKVYYPLASFLFPTISDYNSVLFNNTGYENTLSSIFIYTPMMLLLIPSIIESFKHRKISHMIAIMFFVLTLFTPIMYYLYHGFTLDYGRWEIFVVVGMLIYIAMNFEKIKEFPKWYFDVSALIIMILMAITVVKALEIQTTMPDSVSPIGDRIYFVLYQSIYLVVIYLVMRFEYKKEYFNKLVMVLLSIEVIVMGNMMYQNQAASFQNLAGGTENFNDEQKIVKQINKEDKDFFRIFNTTANRDTNNLGMRQGYNGLGGFHSLYNFEIQDFLNWSHIPYGHQSWSMGIHEKRVNLDEFLGVKYYIIRNSDYNVWNFEESKLYPFDVNMVNVPFGFKYRADLSTELHSIYENEDYIQLGYAFDNIITVGNGSVMDSGHWMQPSQLLSNEEAYLSGAILNDEILYNDYEVDQDGNVTHGEVNEQFANYPIANYTTSSRAQSYTATRYECGSFDPTKPNDKTSCSITVNDSTPYNYNTHYSLKPSVNSTFCSLASEENECYIGFKLETDRYARIYMYDADDKIITHDYHPWMDTSYKSVRGFYVNRPVKTIIVKPDREQGKNNSIYRNSSFAIYNEYYSTYRARIDKLKSYGFENIKVTANTINFDTNYTENKIIVLNVPYDEGWSLNLQAGGIKTPAKIFKAQGGFISFIAPSGDVHYSISYFTPQLKNGLYLSLCGFFLFGLTYGAGYYMDKKRKRKKLEVKEESLGN